MSDPGNSSVTVISGVTNTVIGSIEVGPIPDFIPGTLLFDPYNGDIYVLPVDSGTPGDGYVPSHTVLVISGSTNYVIATLTVGYGPSDPMLDASNGDIYVVNTNDYTVSVISGATNTVNATVDFVGFSNGVPSALEPTGRSLVDQSTSSIYVGVYTSNWPRSRLVHRSDLWRDELCRLLTDPASSVFLPDGLDPIDGYVYALVGSSASAYASIDIIGPAPQYIS